MEFLQTTTVLRSALQTVRHIEGQNQQDQPKQYDKQYFPSGFQVTRYYKRFMTLEKGYCIILIIQIFLSIVYYELNYDCKYDESFMVLYMLLILSAASLLFSTLALVTFNQWKRKQLHNNQIKSPRNLVLDWVIILIQPYIFLESQYIWNWDYKAKVYMQYKLNYVFVILSLVKLYLIIPCIMNLLRFKNPRSLRVCKMYGCFNPNIFQLKCYFRTEPIKLMASMFLILILFFSFAFRVGQRNKYSNNNFQYYYNCVWMVVITITSVGFGDFTPLTSIGRTVGFICIFCGVMTVSIMVLVVGNTFQMDYGESNALKILNRLQIQKKMKKVAAQYIRITLWRVWNNYKIKQYIKQGKIQRQSKQQKSIKYKFRQLTKSSKYSEMSEIDLSSEMHKHFERSSVHMQRLNINCDTLLHYLSQQYLSNSNSLAK